MLNKNLFLNPFFVFGLFIRFLFLIFLAPKAVSDWYVPFLEASVSQIIFDPWSFWVKFGGAPEAFPYGYSMWIIFLPFTILTKLLNISCLFAYQLTILISDILLLLTLYHFLPKRRQLILLTYWMSPVIILATYGYGFNDIIPVLLIVLSFLFVKKVKLTIAGVFTASAISAKLSMVFALPLILIYLFNNKSLRQIMFKFLIGLGTGLVGLGIPFLLSSSGLSLLIGNPEMVKIYQVSIGLTNHVHIFIVPLIYLITLYLTWRIRRLNFDLFQDINGLIFLLIVLMIPASPGWFVWSLPFLVLYQSLGGPMGVLLVTLFSCLYVLSSLLVIPLQFKNGIEFSLNQIGFLSDNLKNITASILHTAMVAIGILLTMRIWREAISRNDFFRLSRKPFVIGIAGDSGAGKDTYADAITGLFGNHSVVKLSGDDYHLWDRQKPMWQMMTHLNPMANDLEGFCTDLVALVDGKKVWVKHYNHKTGKMSKPFQIASNDFIIASGLHALYLTNLRECYDIKIYLDIDEELRRHFKIIRDVKQRGHTLEKVLNSFEKREPDSERFIRPQSQHADLIFSLQPTNYKLLNVHTDNLPLRLKLVVIARTHFNELSLHRTLVGLCGLHVDIEMGKDGAGVQLTIEGETPASYIAMSAEILCPRVMEFLDIPPKWEDGIMGIMQLLTLSHINQSFVKRFI